MPKIFFFSLRFRKYRKCRVQQKCIIFHKQNKLLLFLADIFVSLNWLVNMSIRLNTLIYLVAHILSCRSLSATTLSFAATDSSVKRLGIATSTRSRLTLLPLLRLTLTRSSHDTLPAGIGGRGGPVLRLADACHVLEWVLNLNGFIRTSWSIWQVCWIACAKACMICSVNQGYCKWKQKNKN